MALINKNITITPNTGTENDPAIVFTGEGNNPVTLSVSSNNTVVFSSPTANILALGADGNVGIGTTAPRNLLDVAGSINIRDNITVSNITIANKFVISSNSGIAGNIVSTASAQLGNLSILNATPTTSSSTGALTVNGGVGIAGNAYIGGNIIYGGVTFANAVTGTGGVVLSNAPVLLTPNIGSATGNSFSAFATIRILNTTAPPAGGTTGYGYKIGTGTNFGVFYGSGIPTLTANQGSLYLRSDGTPYYNIDGSTGWTSLLSSSGGTITGSTTLAAPLTYGGVTLSNSAIGTGSLVLNNSPSFTGTITTNGNISTANSMWVGNLAITNASVSTGSTTGALVVSGGAGVGGNIHAGGIIDAQSIDNTAIGNVTPNTGQFTSAQVQNTLTAGSLNSNGLISGSSLYSGATISAAGAITGSSITGNSSVTGGTISATSTLSTVDLNVTGSTSFTNVVATTSSTSGAVKISGGIATAANLYVAGASWQNNISVLSTNAAVSTSTGAMRVSGGIGVANGAVFGGNVGIGTTSISGFTNNALAVFGATLVSGNIALKDSTTQSGIVFNDGSFQKTSAVIASYSYDNRAGLRSLNLSDGTLASVDSLGIFVFRTGSDEPDDDETCFATNTGRWLIQTIHPELAEALTIYDEDFYNEQRFLFGSSYQGQIGVGPAQRVTFDIVVVNAFPGDSVVVNPPTDIGAQLSIHSFVYDRNRVRVYINNSHKDQSGYTTAGYWKALVIKEY